MPPERIDSSGESGSRQERQKVLICLSTYLPGYKAGGPIRSIENLVRRIGDEFEFRIVTADRDLGENTPYSGIEVHRWIPVQGVEVLYLRPGMRGLLHLGSLLRGVGRETVLYLNSFLSPRFSIFATLLCWLGICRPKAVVLAPRGEFSRGALGLKRGKKRCYLIASKALGLHQSVLWQASSDLEKMDILRQFPVSKQVEVAGNLAQSVAMNVAGHLLSRPSKTAGRLRLLFVSRLSRMKNLSGALRVLQRVDGEVVFDIYGPAEDAEYWRECQKWMAALPSNVKARYHGEIGHDELPAVFAEHDLLFLPTLGENFGHVISESLTAGCPVLISDRTPWRDLEAEGVGWTIPVDDIEGYRAVLHKCMEGDARWHAAMSMKVLQYAAGVAADPATVAANRRLFRRAFQQDARVPLAKNSDHQL